MDLQDFIIGPQLPIGTSYFDKTQVERGKILGRDFPATPPTGAEVDAYTLKHYYDLGRSMMIDYKRTQDPEFLTLFRKVEDSWWKTPNWIEEGRVRQFDVQGTAPKSAGIQGLILRALGGRPEMWDWINAYVRYSLNLWVMGHLNDSQLYIGIREGAFALQDASCLALALPDSFPLQAGGTETNGSQLRAQYLADCEKAAVDYFGRLQYPDGSWRWDDFYYQSDDGGQLRGITQPFQVGLALHALINVYQITTKETVKTSIVSQVTKACRHLYSDGPYTKQHLNTLNVDLRGFHYFYHGGTTVNPTRYEKGDLPIDWNPASAGDVQNQRQPIGLLVAGYGWSYQQTQDSFFKLAGDELWDSAYGSTDGIHNYMAGDGKSYNQNCRWAGSYLVWAGQPATQPIPIPAPTPTPTPTTSSTVTDSTGGVWTIGPNKETLRNGTQMGGGQGTEYRYVDSIVYVLGMDKNWYKWSGSWVFVGATEPSAPSPTPTPTPAPAPTTPMTRKVAWPKTESGQDTVLKAQWAEGYRLQTTKVSGDWAVFEKVK